MIKKRILIIDSDFKLNKKLSKFLNEAGFLAYQAFDGKEGLQMVQDLKPDLVIIEISLPEMDGLTLIKKLKDIQLDKNINIIILTNINSKEFIVRASELFVQDYLVKSNTPFDEIIHRVKYYS